MAFDMWRSVARCFGARRLCSVPQSRPSVRCRRRLQPSPRDSPVDAWVVAASSSSCWPAARERRRTSITNSNNRCLALDNHHVLDICAKFYHFESVSSKAIQYKPRVPVIRNHRVFLHHKLIGKSSSNQWASIIPKKMLIANWESI